MWIILAFLSAFFAGITAILAKCGIRQTDSTVATACAAGSMSPISAGAGTGCSVRRSAAFSSFRRLILPCTRMPVSARER